MDSINNNIIRQIFIILLIGFLGIIIIWKLVYFIPGFLGAGTLYIMLRNKYFKLVEDKGWKKGLTAFLFILSLLVLMVAPTIGLAEILIPKVNRIISNTEQIKSTITNIIDYVQNRFPFINISQEKINTTVQKAAIYVPKILGATANVFANIFTALFILYFLFMGGKKMEGKLNEYIPLNRRSKGEVWKETQNMVVSNAIGIPFLALCQALVALAGYLVCGVPGAVLWALLTGVATIIPVLGTMIVWVPVCIYLFTIGEVPYGIGLGLYCLVVVGLTDNVVRFMFLKKFGDVHPLITVFGVILGLNIFGVMGLIFGPLMVSYFMMLIRIYKAEYGKNAEDQIVTG